MRVVVAIGDLAGGGAPFAERLRDGSLDVRRIVAPDAPAAAAADALAGPEAADLVAELARADVLVVPARRSTVTPALVAACDRWGVRIVAIFRREIERRSAETYGVATMPHDADPLDIVRAAPRTPASADARRPRGRALVVWGAAGSPGRTTLAIELACELARDGRRVGLADADAHAPSLALALGLADEGPGFAAACRLAGRGELTPAELARIAVPMGDLEVLPGVNRPGRWPELSGERVERAIDVARDWVDDIVIDVAAPLERDEEIVSDLDGPRRNAATLAALGAADAVVAVVAADPVGVSRFVRAYPDLRAAAGAAPVHVLVNKTRGGALGIDPRGQVRRSLERYAGAERCWFVPWDGRAADAALLGARPIAHGGARGAVPAAVRRFVGEAIVPPPAAGARRARGRRAGAPTPAASAP